MKKKYENLIIHYRGEGKISSDAQWSYWYPVCGKKSNQIMMLTSIKEKVTCRSCKKTADYY